MCLGCNHCPQGHYRSRLNIVKRVEIASTSIFSFLFLLLFVSVLIGCAPGEQNLSGIAPDSSSSIETIVFADYNWLSTQIQNRIAQYIVEMGYGYSTDVVFGATLPLFQGLRRGEIHVSLEDLAA